jgi:subtilisin family serine protease
MLMTSPCCCLAAADNLNNDITPTYPHALDSDNIISVGSITSSGSRSSFSNYGQNTVDLFAPGSNIYSSIPFNSYSTYSGTSEYSWEAASGGGSQLQGWGSALGTGHVHKVLEACCGSAVQTMLQPLLTCLA